MNDRYRRAIDIGGQLASDKVAHFVESGVAEIAPDFARMVIEFALGDIYARDVLDLRTRELIAIAALAAGGKATPQLRLHVEAAEGAGISRAEIIEVMMQVALYAGIPAALNALADCHDLLADGEGACPWQAARAPGGRGA
jgi:4-carboxymuconolactone decarboxylase